MQEVECALVLVRMDPSELDLVTLFERLGFDLDLLEGVDQSVELLLELRLHGGRPPGPPKHPAGLGGRVYGNSPSLGCIGELVPIESSPGDRDGRPG